MDQRHLVLLDVFVTPEQELMQDIVGIPDSQVGDRHFGIERIPFTDNIVLETLDNATNGLFRLYCYGFACLASRGIPLVELRSEICRSSL